MLAELRVLDLTDHRGEVGPWLLGRLGAEVIRVEPPAGSPARLQHPLLDSGPDDLRSLQFAAYNDDKRSIALDVAGSGDDRATLLRLVAGADIVFESGPPGALAAAGVAEADLVAANDRLVHVIVTPFGVDGPRADQPASELTLSALGGPMSLQGVEHRAPLKISVPQVWRHAGAEAAVAALIALRRAEATGRAQWVDVSAQTAMTWTMLNAMEAAEVQGFDFERCGLKVKLALTFDIGHLAADGWVCQIAMGITCGSVMPWLVEEGIAPPHWVDQDWATYDHRALSGEDVDPTYADLAVAIDELCSRHTTHELMLKGLERGATFAPVNNVADLLELGHLDQRGFWSDGPELADVAAMRRPGTAVTVDGVRPHQRSAVPSVDEGGDELRAEPQRARRTPIPHPDATSEPLPLDGVKVADFSWIGVGPITAKYLADHGATVVRIESETRLDTLRAQPPFKDDEFGIDRSNFYGSFNTSKQSIAVDMTTPGGRDIARRMTEWADVVIDSFRPGTMERLGLGPEAIRAANPGVITVTTSLVGGGGELERLAGYGYHAAAIAGFTDLVGWPDLGPDGPWMAYTDTIGPRVLAATVLAALDRRDRTGEGCHLEGAQLEMGLQFLAPELLDLQATGRRAARMGNRDLHMAPQGAYPCSGDDQWCTITVPDDATWAVLVEVLGSPAWATDRRYATAAGRLADPDSIDDALGAWTAQRSADDVERQLAAAGIPAGKVQRSSDLRTDPQYLHRHFYRRLDHPEVGLVPYAGHQFRIRGVDHGPRAPAPTLGQHTFEVLGEALGMSPDEIAEAAASDALR